MATDKLVRVKWAGPNTPFVSVERLDHRIYLTKRELLEMHEALSEFIDFYSDSFEKSVIDNQDEIDWDDLSPRWKNRDIDEHH